MIVVKSRALLRIRTAAQCIICTARYSSRCNIIYYSSAEASPVVLLLLLMTPKPNTAAAAEKATSKKRKAADLQKEKASTAYPNAGLSLEEALTRKATDNAAYDAAMAERGRSAAARFRKAATRRKALQGKPAEGVTIKKILRRKFSWIKYTAVSPRCTRVRLVSDCSFVRSTSNLTSISLSSKARTIPYI